jgi:SAM-dependent methyltransferase
MHSSGEIDQGRTIDWGLTSDDYARYRPGYPASFYQRLRQRGLGVPPQRILDLGTGTGVLARQFAAQGCTVTGIDISAEQLEAAEHLAHEAGLEMEFHVAPAEDTGFPEASFDLLTAAQCWLYFDAERVIAEVLRLLAPGGRLMTCHLCWLPREDAIARATEQLVLRHNPHWSAADWSGVIPDRPMWARNGLEVEEVFWYDEPVEFSYESWCGRIRACRGVGAALAADEVARFDAEHLALLRSSTPEPFAVLHRIDCEIGVPGPLGDSSAD